MKFKKSDRSLAGALLMSLLILSFFASCEKVTFGHIPMEDDGRIVFGVSGLVTVNVTTKAVYPVESLTSFYVSAVKGTPGNDISIFSSAAFTQVPESDPAVYVGNKRWASTDEGWRFYASNVAMTFGAGGATLTFAEEPVDAVCAYAASPTYGTKNILSFQHIFARLGSITFNAADGYTVSGITYWIEDFTNTGTYNLFTGAGQSDGTGWTPGEPTLNRGVVIGTLTPENPSMTCPLDGGQTSKAWVVPGQYYLKATWTASRNEWSQTYTEILSISPVLLQAGKVNNLSLNFTGNELRAEVIVNDDVTWITPAAGEDVAWVDQIVPIGRFTINYGGDQVGFAPGNLQCTIASGPDATGYNYTGTDWCFAKNQWDYLGPTGPANSFTIDKKMDLFGWVGESASYDTYGLCSNNNNNPYYGTSGSDGTDALNTDWGDIPGVISACGDGWRSLDIDEWGYVFDSRTGSAASTIGTTTNVRYAMATIRTDETGVNGIILFPDRGTFETSDFTTLGTVNGGPSWDSCTKCTAAQWTALEAKGCVFLPAAGLRMGTGAWMANGNGYYWSTSPYGRTGAFLVAFHSDYVKPQTTMDRYFGFSVRLVKRVN